MTLSIIKPFPFDEVQSTVGYEKVESPIALAYRTRPNGQRTTTPRTRTTPRPRPTTPRPRPVITTPRPRPTTPRPRPTLPVTTTPRPRPTTPRPRPTLPATTTPRPRPTTSRPRPTMPSQTTPRPRPTTTSKPRTTYRPPAVVLTTRRTTTWRPTTRKTVRTTRRTTTTTTKPWVKQQSSFNELPPPPGSKAGKTKIKIKNEYHYHYPGFYTLPQAHDRYPGYYQTHSSYSYSSSDTGSGLLGFYLGYQLGKISTPTYSHQSFYDGYRPRYDHYTVHHYYHNANAVPKEQNFGANSIVGCVGDSTSICPAQTTSLCTSDGRLMCVVPVANLGECVDSQNNRIKCLKTTISCVNNTAPECKNSVNSVTIDVPCVSTAKIEGQINYVNNTIVTSRKGVCSGTIVSCVGTSSSYCLNIKSSYCFHHQKFDDVKYLSSTAMTLNGTTFSYTNCTGNWDLPQCHYNKTLVYDMTSNYTSCNGVAINCTNSTAQLCSNKPNFACYYQGKYDRVNFVVNYMTINGTEFPYTNCTENVLTQPCRFDFSRNEIRYVNNTVQEAGNSSVHWIWKRSVHDQDFCVTVMAVPAPRQPTEGEEFLQDAGSVLNRFIEAAWKL